MLWAAFALFFVAMLTQWLQPGSYIITRGLGLVGVPDGWTIVSVQLDRSIFVALAFAVLFVHTFLSGFRGRSGGLSLGTLLLFALGLVGFEFSSSIFLLPMALGFTGILGADSRSVATIAGLKPRSTLASALLWVLVPVTAVAVLGTLVWVWAGIGGPYPVQLGTSNFATAELALLGLGYPVVSWLVVAFLFSWVLRLALASRIHPAEWPRGASREEEGQRPDPRPAKSRWPAVLLVLATAIAVFTRVYVYLPAINPLGLRVGTDAIRGYACWLGLAPQGIPFNECVPSWWNLHIGALWTLQGITLLTRSADLTMKLAPALWGVFFDFATYILVKEGTGDSMLAGVSALFSAVSLETLVGIDAGILANWLALPVAFLFFAAMLKMFRTRNPLYLVPGLGLFVALFLIHPWTWFLMAVIFAGYLSLELVQGWRSRLLKGMKLEAVILSALVATGLIALVGSGLLTSLAGLYVGYETAISSVNIYNVPNTVANLQSSLIQWVGGGMTDPVWYVLGALGVLALPTLRGRFSKLLVVWLAAVAIAVPLGSGPSLIQERIIFDIPFQIFAAIGAVWLARVLSRNLPLGTLWHWRGHDLVLPVIVMTTTLLALGFDLEYIGFLFRI